MLRPHFVEQWFNLSEPAMADPLRDIESARRFAGANLITDLVADETTFLRSRQPVHRVATGPAPRGDLTRLDELLHGHEQKIFVARHVS